MIVANAFFVHRLRSVHFLILEMVYLRIPKYIIEKTLTDNSDGKYVNLSFDDVINESYADALARLATINAICVSDISDSEKVTEIYEQTKSRR